MFTKRLWWKIGLPGNSSWYILYSCILNNIHYSKLNASMHIQLFMYTIIQKLLSFLYFRGTLSQVERVAELFSDRGTFISWLVFT